MIAFERLDHQIFALTGGLASGHNLKHVTVGIALGCVFTWLARRRPREATGAATRASTGHKRAQLSPLSFQNFVPSSATPAWSPFLVSV